MWIIPAFYIFRVSNWRRDLSQICNSDGDHDDDDDDHDGDDNDDDDDDYYDDDDDEDDDEENDNHHWQLDLKINMLDWSSCSVKKVFAVRTSKKKHISIML